MITLTLDEAAKSVLIEALEAFIAAGETAEAAGLLARGDIERLNGAQAMLDALRAPPAAPPKAPSPPGTLGLTELGLSEDAQKVIAEVTAKVTERFLYHIANNRTKVAMQDAIWHAIRVLPEYGSVVGPDMGILRRMYPVVTFDPNYGSADITWTLAPEPTGTQR